MFFVRSSSSSSFRTGFEVLVRCERNSFPRPMFLLTSDPSRDSVFTALSLHPTNLYFSHGLLLDSLCSSKDGRDGFSQGKDSFCYLLKTRIDSLIHSARRGRKTELSFGKIFGQQITLISIKFANWRRETCFITDAEYGRKAGGKGRPVIDEANRAQHHRHSGQCDGKPIREPEKCWRVHVDVAPSLDGHVGLWGRIW
jgi:hypothetical protein